MCSGEEDEDLMFERQIVQVRLVVSAVVTTCAHADEKASTLFHMDQSGLLLHVTGPVRAKMQGGGVVRW